MKSLLKGYKNDYRNAKAIAEAVQRPIMQNTLNQAANGWPTVIRDATAPLYRDHIHLNQHARPCELIVEGGVHGLWSAGERASVRRLPASGRLRTSVT